MRQMWAVAIKDATEVWRDGRLRGLAILVLALLAVGGLTGLADARRDARERADAQQAERDRWLGQGDVNPHAAAHYGTFVFRPVEPLSALDPGITPYIGAAVFLEAHQQQLARHRPVDDAAPVRRLGTLSAAMAMQVLVPLLVVLFTFGAVAGERERGTWRLLLGAGVGPRTIAWGKAVGLALMLGAVLAPPVLVGGAAWAWSSRDGLDAQAVARLAVMAAAYTVYLGIWASIGLAISALVSSTRMALAVLLAFWLGTCVVAPPLGMSMATVADPALSTAHFAASIDDDRARRPSWDERVAIATERFLAGGDLPPASNPEVVALIETEEDDTAIYTRHFNRLADTFARQAGAYRWMGVVSPRVAMQAVSMSMAATDYAHTRHFMAATAGYRDAVLGVLNTELAGFDSWKTFNATSGRDLWARVPEFDYDTPGVEWALDDQAGSLAVLAAWLGASLILAAWSLRRAFLS